MQSWPEKSAEAIVDQTRGNNNEYPVNSGCEIARRARNMTRQFSPDGPGRCSPDGYGFCLAIEAKFKAWRQRCLPFSSELPKSAASATGRSTNAQTDEK